MNYGLPYMGSKNGIAEWVISKMPKSRKLYDLFCGGGAITHAALLTNKFGAVHMNDLNPMSRLFIDAVQGKYHNENRWISREEFIAKKDTDPYIAFVWSFGNNCKGYLYNDGNERVKHALWNAVMFGDYTLADELHIPFKRSKYTDTKHRRLDIMRHWKKYGNKMIDRRMELQSLESLERLQSLESLERLQSLERLERLQSLERLESRNTDEERHGRLTYTCKPYNEVEIEPDSLIYCDIPYKNTAEYVAGGFNHAAFYKWAHNQQNLVMVSEYNMPSDFVCVGAVAKRNILSATANTKAIERLFVPDNQLAMYEERMRVKINS